MFSNFNEDFSEVTKEAPKPTCFKEKFEHLEEKLGIPPERICLLDMDAPQALEPEDVANFDVVVFGGILGNIYENEDGSYGSDDRTAEVRHCFKNRRHLGPMQMTTDTAVLVTKLVLEDRRCLADIPFLDCPRACASCSVTRWTTTFSASCDLVDFQ